MPGKILTGGASRFEQVTNNLGVYFFNQADIFQDNVIQIHGDTGEKETFASVKLRSIRFAINLRNLGAQPDDIVMICLRMGMHTMIPVISTMFLCAKFSAIDPIQTARDWTHCIDTVNPKFVIIDEEEVTKLEKCLDTANTKPEIIVLGNSDVYKTFDDLMKSYPEVEASFRPAIVDCHETATILFSSGTTGLPKATKLSHFGLINQEINIRDSGILGSKVFLLFSTYYWITSMTTLVGAMYTGGCRVIVPKFDPENALRIIQDHKVTTCLIPPSLTRQILALKNKEGYDTSSVLCYLSGGNPMPIEHFEKTSRLFKNAKVYNVYGSTEFSGIATCIYYEKDLYQKQSIQSVGKCMPEYDLKIIDEQTGEMLGPNEHGEICVRSIYEMLGYFNNDSSSKVDKDGFMKMGDKGFYDEDECVYIVGRCNENFKYGFVKVAPNHWESVLQEHPAVEEAAVLGIPHITDGFLPAACIVLKSGVYACATEIDDFFVQNMTERQRLVGGIKFVEKLPKTPSTKLQRRKLLDLFLNQ